MIQSTLDAFENDLEAIFDGRIADAEIVKQNQRFAGLMRQAGGPREGLEILAKQTPESIARLFIATDSFRHFVKSATSIPLKWLAAHGPNN